MSYHSEHDLKRLRHHANLPGGPWYIVDIQERLAAEKIIMGKDTVRRWIDRWQVPIKTGVKPENRHKGGRPVGATDSEPRQPYANSLRGQIEQIYMELTENGKYPKRATYAEIAFLIGKISPQGVRYHMNKIRGDKRKKPSSKK